MIGGEDDLTSNNSLGVDTKCHASAAFGNDSIGFVRVRRRKLNPLRAWGARTSASFDLVRAVRVNGKPRHKFVLGLGSQKDGDTGRMAAYTLLIAIGRMKKHGLNQLQRQALLAELIRKGARRPTVAECEGWLLNASWEAHVEELVIWLKLPAQAAEASAT